MEWHLTTEATEATDWLQWSSVDQCTIGITIPITELLCQQNGM